MVFWAKLMWKQLWTAAQVRSLMCQIACCMCVTKKWFACVCSSCWLLRVQGFLQEMRSGQQECWRSEEGLLHHRPGQQRLHWGGRAEVRRSTLTEDRLRLKKSKISTWNDSRFLRPGCSCRTSLPLPERSVTRRPRLSSLPVTVTAMARSEWKVRPDVISDTFLTCLHLVFDN